MIAGRLHWRDGKPKALQRKIKKPLLHSNFPFDRGSCRRSPCRSESRRAARQPLWPLKETAPLVGSVVERFDPRVNPADPERQLVIAANEIEIVGELVILGIEIARVRRTQCRR